MVGWVGYSSKKRLDYYSLATAVLIDDILMGAPRPGGEGKKEEKKMPQANYFQAQGQRRMFLID